MNSREVREKTFKKSMMSGYSLLDVNEFLEEVARVFDAKDAEIETLKKKGGILAKELSALKKEKDEIAKVVTRASQLADQMESDARLKAEEIKTEATAVAYARLSSIRAEIELEERKLADAKEAMATYFEKAREICNRQLDCLDSISDKASTGAASDALINNAVKSIEDSVERISVETSLGIDISKDIIIMPEVTDNAQSESTNLFSMGLDL